MRIIGYIIGTIIAIPLTPFFFAYKLCRDVNAEIKKQEKERRE